MINTSLRMHRRIFALLLPAFLIGCGTSGNNFAPENIRQISIGKTTRADIQKLFGEGDPIEKVIIGDLTSEIESYHYRKTGGMRDRWDYKFITFEYVRDTVNGYLYNNSFDGYSTDFDVKKVDELPINKTTREEVSAKLGKWYGRVRLPSNMLERSLTDKSLSTIPASAKTAVLYYYHYRTEGSGPFLTNTVKSLLLSFDEHDILLSKFYWEVNPSK